MNDSEKYSLLADVLKNQHHAIDYMTDDQLKDYIELMSIFLKTNDPIHQESSLATMKLIVKNTMK
ncbi:hypothetical protein [Bacillus andreraoultii]|uniref:hypothetical protein n=1 Tax=Bacillus andreraoultii TaxID=1499685 RepID=UPI00053A6FCD|nr:hypothetical protein [Bacillus andreraoultii]